jgi:hypothetical protein
MFKKPSFTPGPWKASSGEFSSLRQIVKVDCRGNDPNKDWIGNNIDWLVVPEDIHIKSGTTEADAILIASAPTGFSTAEETYIALLQMPHNAERMRLQPILCKLRDYIAEATGNDIEDVQNEYEERALTGRGGTRK